MYRLGRFMRSFPWGEASLWVLFLVSGLGGASDSNDTTMTFAGLCLLAAIGVRATRLPKVKTDEQP